MKAEEFIKQMSAATPTKDVLMKAGRSATSADRFIRSRECVRRKSPLNFGSKVGSEDLIELFSIWDPSAITVGMIQLLDVPVDRERGLQIGVDEAEPLMISSTSGEVIVEEEGTDGHRLSDVAQNGNSLLDALIKAANFLSDRAIGNVSYDDFNAAKSAARDCAVAAGGETYLRFYIYLLGADE